MASRVQIFVPPNLRFTARNIYDFYRLQNADGPNAMAMRQRLGQALGLGPGATSRQIEGNNVFGNYYRRYLNLVNAGGLIIRNRHGRNRWPVAHPPLIGRLYSRYSAPIVQERAHRIRTIPRAIFASAPLRLSRAGLISVGLSRNPHNANGVQRPALPGPVARQIGNLIRRLERMLVRENTNAPLPRSLRALPPPPPPPPAPRRSTRRRN